MNTTLVDADSRFVPTRTAAKIMGFSFFTLQKWRSEGSDGPPFYKVSGNRIVYDREEIIAWVQKHRHVPAATQLAARA
jgi:predicted DNA-binding transcriptional regulator AlpA